MLRQLTILILIVTIMGSCNKNLKEYNPSNTTADALWSTPAGFVTAVNGAYSTIPKLYGSDENYMFLSEMGNDLWDNQTDATYDPDIMKYVNFTSASTPTGAVWTLLYTAINQCNAGIGRIGNAGFTNPVERNAREAELRFLRAYYYWDVVETWGGVILDTVETTTVQLTAQRSPVSAFYDLIFRDLQFAVANLPALAGKTDTVSSGIWEYGRATKAAAMGMLARAYLSRAYYSTGADAANYFQLAHDMATQLISNAGQWGISLYANYADMWDPSKRVPNSNAKNNQESIFWATFSSNTSLDVSGNGNRTNLWFLTNYSGFSATSIPGLSISILYGNDQKNRRFMPTRALLDFYNDTIDSRYAATFQEVWLCNTAHTWTMPEVSAFGKDPSIAGHVMNVGDTAMWISKHAIPNQSLRPYVCFDRNYTYSSTGAISAASDRWVVLKKYMDPLTKTGTTTYPGYLDNIIMRLPEIYLIAAEAAFQQGNTTEAATLINVLRTRAAIKTPVDHTADMQVSASDITLNFILDERARELCGEYMRWFDLKRTGQLGNRIQLYNPDITSFKPDYSLRPVPMAEIQALTNGAAFGQNSGY